MEGLGSGAWSVELHFRVARCGGVGRSGTLGVGRGLADLEQQRLAQDTELAPGLRTGVGAAPLRKSERDLCRNHRSLVPGDLGFSVRSPGFSRQPRPIGYVLFGDEPARADARPVQIRVQRNDTQRAIVSCIAIIDRVVTRKPWPLPRRNVMVWWLWIV